MTNKKREQAYRRYRDLYFRQVWLDKGMYQAIEMLAHEGKCSIKMMTRCLLERA